MSSGLFKMLPANYSFKIIYIYIYKQDLTLNNLQGLVYHKNQPNNLKKNTQLIISPDLHALMIKYSNLSLN